MEYRSKVIDHLGIVSGVCREIHLVEEINRMVGVNDQQKVTTGDAVLAMVINALGFTSKPLYLFPGFMHNKPVELLIREGLKPEDFNDDTLGRALDRLYQNNPTQIFMHISLKVAKLMGVEKKFLHLDTTTMSVHGQYQQQEEDMTPITITYGRPNKNGRSDLKQFIVSLITLSQSDLPIWLDVLSGNASDKNHFPEVIKKFSKELAAGDSEEVYYVMDAALYSDDNIREISPLVRWISRVPENIWEAKRLIQECETEKMAKSSLEGYKHQAYRSNYGGVEQKWLVVFSEKGYQREMETLKRNIKKEGEKIERELWHLGNREFNCPEDALSAVQKSAQGWKYHKLGSVNIVEVNKTGRRGRPVRNMQPPRRVYRVRASFDVDEERVDAEERRRGKFIVATNDLKLDSDQLLEEYKGQQSVERGFRFLKDPLFFASSVFLKKPQRIVSLVMIMVLSLLVYSVAQYKLRRVLEEREEHIPDQKGKPTKRPTMRWVFQLFEGIHLLLEVGGEGEERIIAVLNLREVHRKILALLGTVYEKIYLC